MTSETTHLSQCQKPTGWLGRLLLWNMNESVAIARKTNRQWIAMGRAEIREGSVCHMRFPDNTFDLVTAVETHFWLPDLSADMREVLRVLKPGGRLLVVAEIYKGAHTTSARLAEKHPTGMKLLTVGEHRDLFLNAGCTDVRITQESCKGWICGTGTKPSSPR